MGTIPPSRSHISVPVPEGLTAKSGNSGKFSVALTSIEDGNGCVRRLSAPSLEVEVDRVRPTGRFAKGEKVVIVEGEVAKSALRLTGTGVSLQWSRQLISSPGRSCMPVMVGRRKRLLHETLILN